jgi:hypothetical protein
MYVAFIDLLGFASAVSALGEGEHGELEDAIRTHREPRSTDAYLLYADYTNFKDTFEDTLAEIIEHETDRNERGAFVAFFSDSVFFGSERLLDVVLLTREVVLSLYHANTPVRAGLATGSLSVMSLSVLAEPNGTLRVSAPFFGSSIVRAYRAESSGVKGMRILLHPTVVSDIAAISAQLLVPLPPDEHSLHASHELNLIEKGYPRSSAIALQNEIGLMKEEADRQYHIHHDKTITAIERMWAVVAQFAGA